MSTGCAIRHCLLAFAVAAVFQGTHSRAYAQPQAAGAPPPAGAALQAQEVRDDPGDAAVPADSEPRDNLQIGPVAGIGFPRPFAIAGMVKVQRLVSLGVEYSFLPATTISDVNTSFWAIAADMRVFPFRNAFFVGLRAGRQYLSADTLLVYRDERIPIAAGVKTTFLNPRIGVLWTWSSGVTLGIDAGLQFPVSSRESGALVNADMIDIPQAMPIIDDVRDIADYLGDSTIPTLDLLRLGLLL